MAQWALGMQLTQTHDAYAWYKGIMTYALGMNNHGHNAMARCCKLIARQGALRQWARLEVHGMSDAMVEP